MCLSLCCPSMSGGDAEFIKTVSSLGCEVHQFDPSNSDASAGHPGNSLASNHGKRGVVSQHKMWLEWRTPRKPKKRGGADGVSRTLADITAALGHRTVRHRHANTRRHTQTHTHIWRKTVPNKHTSESLRPDKPRKLPYWYVPIATGLCAIPDCHGNNWSEWITRKLSYKLRPQEGTPHQEFVCVVWQ